MNNAEQANSFLNIIRSLIKEEQSKQDKVEICQIDSVNEDGTANIKMLSDFESVRIIPNISNQSIYDFKSGDLAIIYLIQNQLSNAFIIAKCGPTDKGLRTFVSSGDGGTVIQNITYQNSGSGSGVTSVNGKVGDVIITAEDIGAITTLPNGKLLDSNNNEIFSASQTEDSVIDFIDCGSASDLIDD